MGEGLPRGIIFDFGGVFTNTRPRQAVLHRCEANLGLNEGELTDLLYASETWRAVSSGEISAEEYWQQVTDRLGGQVPAVLESFRYNPCAYEELNKRTVRLAKKLQKRYKMALCSNATLYLDELLTDYGLWPIFDTVVNSAKVGLRKPDPKVYDLTVGRLGLAPSECLLIDDKERNTRAAEALGIKTVVFLSAAQLGRELGRLGIMP
jgi:putative hydrolase of the HAD superfamily